MVRHLLLLWRVSVRALPVYVQDAKDLVGIRAGSYDVVIDKGEGSWGSGFATQASARFLQQTLHCSGLG